MDCPTCSQEFPDAEANLAADQFHAVTEQRFRLLDQIQGQRMKVYDLGRQHHQAATDLLQIHTEMDKWEIGLMVAVDKAVKEVYAEPPPLDDRGEEA